MYQWKNIEDTIAAIATSMGGSIGIVRISGKQAISIAERIFVSKTKKKTSAFKSHRVHYGYAVDRSKQCVEEAYTVVDEVLLTVMRAPQSYTREDVVEISCHGGMVALKTILGLVLDTGARLAEPGEFTRRAFFNGRIDLTQAEAVLDIIQAKTDAFLRVSTQQLKGELTTELELIREQLMNVYTQLEAVLNFPEDDINDKGRRAMIEQIQLAGARVDELLQSGEHGRILKEGIKIVLCGKPNVGKSSLLNVLLKEPRAIVTEIAGTTRDTIEESAQINGIPFQLVDTAGILTPRNPVEEEAVKRSHINIRSADLTLFMLDASQPLTREDDDLAGRINGQNVLVVINKTDLSPKMEERSINAWFLAAQPVRISALKKTGIDALKERIVASVCHGAVLDAPGLLISNIRHIQSLKQCAGYLSASLQSMAEGLSLEFVSEQIKSAVNELDQITGRHIDQDLVDRIFADFCIGK